MGRRGRPPYPDILTPRQWEVLDLLRRGLSDQQIADELDLTLVPATTRPTTTASCRIAMAIVSPAGVLASGSAPSTGC